MFANYLGGGEMRKNIDFQMHFEMPEFLTEQKSHFAVSYSISSGYTGVKPL